MMLPRGSELLLPANPLFVWGSLLLALLANLAPLGRQAALPDLLALVLVFWNVHQPRRVGIGTAFMLGLAMDVHDGALLGQHALAYTLLAYAAIAIHRRLLWFPPAQQAVLVRLAAGASFPGWALFIAPLIEAALWLPATWLLLAPQRRPPDPDQNRPL
jgi:rod shape-determining protein MreD